MQFAAVVLLALFGAVGYGIVHDQVTARVCVEYFTIGHPPIFHTTSPTLLALGWGVIATWWVGLPLGVALAIAARAGSRPQAGARSLVQPMIILLACMGVCALLVGITGAVLAKHGYVSLGEPLASAVPLPEHTGFLADAWAHSASYLSGIVGGLLVARTWRCRLR